MAARYYKVGHNMGYVGTDSEEVVDLCSLWGWSEEEVADYPQAEADAQLYEDEFNRAKERIDTWVVPATKEEYDRQ